MFTNFKKAVVASRIRKAASPINELSKESCDCYVDLITAYMGITKKVVEEIAYLAGKHADAIADAIVTLEPVIKDIQKHAAFKEIGKEVNSMLETFNNTHEASITEKFEVVKEALKSND
jgi:hypothetical protein